VLIREITFWAYEWSLSLLFTTLRFYKWKFCDILSFQINKIKFIYYIYIYFRERNAKYKIFTMYCGMKNSCRNLWNTFCSSKCRIRDWTSKNGLTKIKRQTLFISIKCNSEIKLRVKTGNERCGPFISIKSKVTLHCWTMELN